MFGIFNTKKELLEVDINFVFDKAKYHFETIDNLNLDDNQAYVHSGFFFSWLINKDLHSDFLIEESESQIKKLKERKISATEIYEDWDGVLIGELLNKIGYNFAIEYFDFETGDFVNDYIKTFNCKDPKFFTVENTWNNYDKLAKVLDKRFLKWKRKRC